MRKSSTLHAWRELLKEVAASHQEKRKIASNVGGVSIRTIDRWISGESSPQKPEMIRKLAQIDPKLSEALEEEFPDVFTPKPTLPIERITLPGEFYKRVLHAYAQVSRSAQHWTIFQLVAHQMLIHLDPNQTGLLVLVCSLHNQDLKPFIRFEGAGNSLWKTRQTQEPQTENPWLLQIMTDPHPIFLQTITEDTALPTCILHRENIRAAAYFPLHRSGVAIGGLLICACTEDFFTPARQALIPDYADLMELAIEAFIDKQ